MSFEDLDLAQKSINTIRFLSADSIQRAKSGHPGLPLGSAPMTYVLWANHLKFDPSDPDWIDRDRFVLSAGHGSALLYSMLHLTGYNLSLDDLKNFRQIGSNTPGHPENFLTHGVEATTGPLGQGISNAVGMAIAEAHLAAVYNRPEHKLINHYTYVLASDGDLMEGISYEITSLAGHLKLGKLIVLYDDNDICLAGSTSMTFTEDITGRFECAGWQVLEVHDGNDIDLIDDAINTAKAESDKPKLIRVKTVIGYGSPNKAGSYKSHGAPLGEDELTATKKALGWKYDEPFFIPKDVRDHMLESANRGIKAHTRWEETFRSYNDKFPEKTAEFTRRIEGDIPGDLFDDIDLFVPEDGPLATRVASETVMKYLAGKLPELMGGCADLTPSTFARLKGMGDFQPAGTKPDCVQGTVGGNWDYTGRNIHFGVREHAMGAIAVGMALHGGIIPFTGTFFIFSDYMRPPIRLSALSKLRTIFIFSHDSIGVGEDGPTHQPIEQLMSLRAVPNLNVIRPADANEVIEAWKVALHDRHTPSALIFSRQKLPILDREKYLTAEGLSRGAYILWQSGDGTPDIILIATGSEVHIALKAAQKAAGDGINVRVVSMPCWKIFNRQDEKYREGLLPEEVRNRIAIEAGTRSGWERYVGTGGVVIGTDDFGVSAPGNEVFEKYGITSAHVYNIIEGMIEKGV